MKTILAALVVLASAAPAAAQDRVTITRTEKGDYAGPIARYKEAEQLLESDPQGAISLLDAILSNSKIDKKAEREVRIQIGAADYSEYSMFLPYQLRGKARVNLARKSGKEAARRLLTGAIEDFEESAKRNVPASAGMADEAKKELANLGTGMTTPVPVDPSVKFRAAWEPLVSSDKYKEARDLIESDRTMTLDQRKAFLADTSKMCQEFLITWVGDFRRKFSDVMEAGLDQWTSEDLNARLKLPPAQDLIMSHAVLDWARAHLPAFLNVVDRKAPAHSLASAAVAALPLEEGGENRWFRAVEQEIFKSLYSAVKAEVEPSRDASQAERKKYQERATALAGQWKAFVQKVDSKFLERHRFVADHDRQINQLMEGFPVDLAELDKSDRDLEAVFAAAAPDAELGRIEETLSGFESRSNLTRESRQRLYTARVVAGALRGLLAGKTEEALATELGSYRQKLREVGGALEVKTYGPRVEKVLALLR